MHAQTIYRPDELYFTADRAFPVPRFMRQYDSLNAALRQCMRTDNSCYPTPWGAGCAATYVYGPCACDTGDCGCASQGGARPRGACNLSGAGLGECIRYRGRRLRMVAKVDGGRVYYVSRRGTFKRIEAPARGRGSLRCNSAGTPSRAAQGERAETVKNARQLFYGRGTYPCSDFGVPCAPVRRGRIPVVYTPDGGVVRRYDVRTEGTTVVQPVGPREFQRLVFLSRGAGGSDWP